jgi:protein-disulfide isomerase
MYRVSIALAAPLIVLLALAPSPVAAQAQRAEIEAVIRNYLDRNPEQVQRIIKDYLTKNPDVLQEGIAEYVKRRQNPQAPNAADKVIKGNAAAIFASPRQVTLGNPNGDVTLVEFFDYNCGFCKRATADKINLMKTDPKLKVVLKEFPVLGQGSLEAAQVAVAVRMQDPGGEKYLAFHEKLMGGRGVANRASALAAAREAGLDTARLERDLESSEIKETLDEGRRLASLLGINGTPSYVIGEQVVVGAVGAAALGERIKAARK